MKMSLFAGATALALTAGAAIAQQAYDSSTTRTTTVTTPVAPPAQTTTTVQRTVAPQPYSYNPSSSYREEHVTTQNGQVVERTMRSDTASPQGRTTTYSRTTTNPGDDE